MLDMDVKVIIKVAPLPDVFTKTEAIAKIMKILNLHQLHPVRLDRLTKEVHPDRFSAAYADESQPNRKMANGDLSYRYRGLNLKR
jgi:hypothetical protein